MYKKWTTTNIPDLSGKTIIVTGGNSGLGYESVKAFALKGATVVLACRNLEKGEKAQSEIMKENPAGEIKLMQLDLANLASVREFAEAFGYPVLVKSTAASHNVDNAKRLWSVSEGLTGVSY
jgi:short-subunit dehydrogenase